MTEGRIRRVVYLLESPLSDRDVQRFGIRTVQEAGFEVVVWDLADLYLPAAARNREAPPTDVAVTTIESFDQLTRMCRTLRSDDLAMCILGVYVGQLPSHHRLLTALSASPATLGTISAGHVPRELAVGDDVPEIERLTAEKRSIRLQLRAEAVRIRTAATAVSPVRHTMVAVSRLVYRLRPLDIAWVGTTTASINPAMLNASTVVRHVHTLDYDRIAQHVAASRRPGSGIVLIDSLGPLHPDYELHDATEGAARSTEAINRYFATVRRALDDIERLSGTPVTIAAHPRADPGSLEIHYGGRRVNHEDTASQIAESALVLLAAPSTALSIVTTLRKPALLLTARSFDPYLQVVLPRLSALLHIETWSADTEHSTWRMPTVNDAAYADYVSRFVKRSGTSELPFWTQVARDALAWGTPEFQGS